jgi:hypothetical protein
VDNRSASIPAAVTPGSQPRPLASAIARRVLLYGVLTVCTLLTVKTPLAATETPRASEYGGLLEKHQRGELQALRIREDAERHRLWVLTLEHVYVYDTKNLTLIRRIRLPNWSVADFDFMCPPDMALDRAGTAFVSNNVQPRLLQVDPANFQKKEHQLRLISDKQWEIGFGALAFGPDGTLFALSALAGSLFKIDLASRTASEMVLSEPVAGACALMKSGQSHPRTQPRAVSLCIGLENRSRRLDISSDLTHGRVTNEFCEK